MSELAKSLRFLYGLQQAGIKAGLENTHALLRALGRPERRYPSVHIAGTNGKGSTASMIAAMLTASGYRTGLYTSPHLVHFNERIRIDGLPISDEEIVRYVELLRPVISEVKATFFEATTAIAFGHFARQRIDIAVIETGLGGRLDATNVITPLLSVITNVGLDHTEYLGTSYARIAYEKGGIIKSGVTCLTGTTQPSALRRLRDIARHRGATLICSEEATVIGPHEHSIRGFDVTLSLPETRYEHLRVPLAGDHQMRNLRLAVLCADHLRRHFRFRRLTLSGMRRGLASVRRHSGLRGRLDVIYRSPLMVADVAHNPAGISALVDAVRKLFAGTCLIVFGVMKDKDYGSMLKLVSGIARVTIAVKPGTNRALASSSITEWLQRRGHAAVDGGTVGSGVRFAALEARPGELVLVTGSHYVVGETIDDANNT